MLNCAAAACFHQIGGFFFERLHCSVCCSVLFGLFLVIFFLTFASVSLSFSGFCVEFSGRTRGWNMDMSECSTRGGHSVEELLGERKMWLMFVCVYLPSQCVWALWMWFEACFVKAFNFQFIKRKVHHNKMYQSWIFKVAKNITSWILLTVGIHTHRNTSY